MYIYIYIYIYMYMYTCYVISANCLTIDNQILPNKKNSQGVISKISS